MIGHILPNYPTHQTHKKHTKNPSNKKTKAATDALIASIGREKAVVDEAVEAGRGDEEAAAALQAEVQAFAAEVRGCGVVWWWGVVDCGQ
jgi:hypothetical protein